MLASRRLLALALLGGALALVVVALRPASGHVGAVVAKATFMHPPPLGDVPLADGGKVYPPYTPAEADTHYLIDWTDGDVDPTARFTFFYLDHEIPDAVSEQSMEVDQLGTIVKLTDGREARGIFASCTCTPPPVDGGGYTCAVTDGPRWCDNMVDWDTSGVPDGVYWIAATNIDPPYYVYNTSETPVRVHHGTGPKPPIVIVEKPDSVSIGEGDQSATIVLRLDGTAPFTVDLAWGVDLSDQVLGPVTTIAKGLSAKPDGNGIWTYLWDLRALPDKPYFVQAAVTDGTGLSTYTDSRYSQSVYHHPDLGGVADLASAPPVDASTAAPDLAGGNGTGGHGGCSCGASSRAPSPSAVVALAPLLLLALRRRRRR